MLVNACTTHHIHPVSFSFWAHWHYVANPAQHIQTPSPLPLPEHMKFIIYRESLLSITLSRVARKLINERANKNMLTQSLSLLKWRKVEVCNIWGLKEVFSKWKVDPWKGPKMHSERILLLYHNSLSSPECILSSIE